MTERERQALLERMADLWLQLSKRLAAEMKAQAVQIPTSQVYLLWLLDRHGPLRMSELARHLGIALSGCTAIVDRAVREGWVVRERSPTDRRVVTIALTDQGRETLAQLRQARRDAWTRYLNRLADDELRTLIRLLDTMLQAE